MNKWNKRLILLLILVLTISILAGCSAKKEPPEGVSQEFYDDMLDVLKKLAKTKGDGFDDSEKNGEDIINKYNEDNLWLMTGEIEILEAIEEMHLWVILYNRDYSEVDVAIVKYQINLVAELMDLEIDIDKYL